LVVFQGRAEEVIRVEKPFKCPVFLKAPEKTLLLKEVRTTIILRYMKKA
jgi:hypothetical protein